MNGENLVSLGERATDERREIARRGGIASGQSRRERKAIRQALEEALSMSCEVDGLTLTNVEAIAASMVREARRGNVRAFCAIRDTCEGRPTQSVDVRAEAIPPEAYEAVRRALEEA